MQYQIELTSFVIVHEEIKITLARIVLYITGNYRGAANDEACNR